MKNKKGVITLGQATIVIIVLLTIGVVLTAGLLVLAELQDEATTATASSTVGNESHTGVTQGVAFVVDKRTANTDGFVGTDITVVNSTGVVMDSGNYTFSSTAGTYTMANTTDLYPDGILYINYSFTETERDFAFNSSRSSEEGVDTIASFQSIFGIVVAAAVVLGLVALFR